MGCVKVDEGIEFMYIVVRLTKNYVSDDNVPELPLFAKRLDPGQALTLMCGGTRHAHNICYSACANHLQLGKRVNGLRNVQCCCRCCHE